MNDRGTCERAGRGAAVLGAALLAATIAAPLAAQTANQGAAQSVARGETVANLRIAVYDESGREVAVVSPDQGVLLPRDEPVQLRMFTMTVGGRRVLPTEFLVARGSEMLNHTRNRQDRGEVTVELRPGSEPTGPLYLEYRIHDEVRLADERLRRGRIAFEVEAGLGQEQVDRFVAAMYRAVLLREPDAEGALAARRSIRAGGWEGILRFAEDLATSRESEMTVYERGSCNQARLVAMYRELLGRDTSRVDQRTWRAQLDQMGRGDVAGVVLAMVRSPEVQDRFGLRAALPR